MSISSAPKSTPKPNKGEVKPSINIDPRSVFFSAVIDMSWQLAIVVLIPIVGGYELDNHFKIMNLGIILGFVLAIAGVIVVLRRMLAELNQHFFVHKGDKS
jgi:hypothetical protein